MRTLIFLLFLVPVIFFSCGVDEDVQEEALNDNIEQGDGNQQDNGNAEGSEGQEEEEQGGEEQEDGENTDQGSDCPNSVGFVFIESGGIISIEFEDNDFPEGWVLGSNAQDISGQGFMQWEGNPSMGNPGNGMVTFPIDISTTGTYRFTWKSSYRKGNNGTEHNDSWLRFPDADDFFGMKGNGSVVYPNGSGKEPNPNGASKDGWFKIYRSGNDNAFKWQAKTSDNDGHDIYVIFENQGIYLMEISARSDFHAIDRILMFQEDISQNEAIDLADTFSAKETCN